MPILEIATNFRFEGSANLPLKILKLEYDTETQSLDLKKKYNKDASSFYYLCDKKPDSISSRLIDWDLVDEANYNHSTMIFLPQVWSDLKIVLGELRKFRNAKVWFASYYQFGSDSIEHEFVSLTDFENLHSNRKLQFNKIYYIG